MDRYGRTKRIALLGITANALLLAFKLTTGFLSESRALIADGFNSAGDVFASVMTYAGNKIASRPEDKTHPFGHGKAEYIFSMLISFSLLIVAWQTLSGSVRSIVSGHAFLFSWWLIAVELFTVITKLILYVYTKRQGLKENNLLIVANSEDHRNDVFVSSSALIGIAAGAFGVYWLDGIMGIGISVWIAITGLRIFKNAYDVLMDTNLGKDLMKGIEKTVLSIEGIDHIDEIIAKPIGVSYIIIIKVSVDGEMSVNKSHSIAAEIRRSIKKHKNIRDAVVHINPI